MFWCCDCVVIDVVNSIGIVIDVVTSIGIDVDVVTTIGIDVDVVTTICIDVDVVTTIGIDVVTVFVLMLLVVIEHYFPNSFHQPQTVNWLVCLESRSYARVADINDIYFLYLISLSVPGWDHTPLTNSANRNLNEIDKNRNW